MERPILFSAPMVRAILDGQKTQTRRVIKNFPEEHRWKMFPGYCRETKLLETSRGPCLKISDHINNNELDDEGPIWIRCPFGRAGDNLWVRETWGNADHFYQNHENEEPRCVAYRADRSARQFNFDCSQSSAVEKYDIEQWDWNTIKWKPSIHMSRWACRLLLVVKNIRAQRLQDISEFDAAAEGVAPMLEDADLEYLVTEAEFGHKQAFRFLWENINGKRAGCSWADNPWIWVIEFERLDIYA